MKPRIVIDLDSIRWYANRNATGVIFWDVGGYAFPEIGWNDFVLVLVEWWSAACLRLLRKGARTEELRFMDGPFWVVIEGGVDDARMRCVDGRRGVRVVREFQVRKEDVCTAILQAAVRLCAHCESVAAAGEQIRRIRKSCKHLESCGGRPNLA